MFSGCDNKDKLTSVNEIAVVGLSYGKQIVEYDEQGHKITEGVLLGVDPKKLLKKGGSLKERGIRFLPIDEELKAYFDSLYNELINVCIDNGKVIKKATEFPSSPALSNLIEDPENSLIYVSYPQYSPAPYASGAIHQKKSALRAIASEQNVDAVLLITFEVVRKKGKTSFLKLPSYQLGLSAQIGLMHADGTTILRHSQPMVVYTKKKVDWGQLISSDIVKITGDNKESFEELKLKMIHKVSQRLRIKKK